MNSLVGRGAFAALAAALLLFGLPQTAVSSWRLYADRNIDPYAIKDAAAANAAAQAYPKLEALDTELGDPDARIEAATLRLQLASGAAGSRPSPGLIQEASGDLESALARAPANDLAWYELAEARFRLDDPAGAREALKTSMLLGFYDPALNLARSALGVKLWLALDTADVQLVQNEVRSAWLSDPDGVAALARQDPWTANFVRHALDGEQRGAFETRFSRHP